ERARGLADQLGEAEGLEVARAVVRRVGVGDVLRQHLLALAQPGEVLRHRLEQWDVVEIHRRAAALWAMADAVGILLKRRKTLARDGARPHTQRSQRKIKPVPRNLRRLQRAARVP